MAGDEQPSERADYRSGADDQQDAHGGRWRIGEDTEGDARIAAVHKVDEIVDQFAVPAFRGLRFEPCFAGAVEEDDGKGEPEPAEAGGNHSNLELGSLRRRLAVDLGLGREGGGKTTALQRNASDCRMGGCAFDFRERFAAPFAGGGIARVLADVNGIVPAALALFAGRSVHNDNQISCSSYFCDGSRRFENVIRNFNLRNNKKGRKIRQMRSKEIKLVFSFFFTPIRLRNERNSGF